MNDCPVCKLHALLHKYWTETIFLLIKVHQVYFQMPKTFSIAPKGPTQVWLWKQKKILVTHTCKLLLPFEKCIQSLFKLGLSFQIFNKKSQGLGRSAACYCIFPEYHWEKCCIGSSLDKEAASFSSFHVDLPLHLIRSKLSTTEPTLWRTSSEGREENFSNARHNAIHLQRNLFVVLRWVFTLPQLSRRSSL